MQNWFSDPRTQALRDDLNNANSQTRGERSRANNAKEDAELAKRQVDSKNQTIDRFLEEIDEKNRRIAELTVKMEEWILSQTAFKKLALKYGEELGMEKDEIAQEFRERIIEEHSIEPNEMTKPFVEKVKKTIRENQKTKNKM